MQPGDAQLDNIPGGAAGVDLNLPWSSINGRQPHSSKTTTARNRSVRDVAKRLNGISFHAQYWGTALSLNADDVEKTMAHC